MIGSRHLGGAGFLIDKMILEVLLQPPKSPSHQPLVTDTELAIDRKDPFYYGPPKNKVWRYVRQYTWTKGPNKDRGGDNKDRGRDNNSGSGSSRGRVNNQLSAEEGGDDKMGIWNWTVAEGSVLWTPSQTNFTKNTLIEHCITLQLGGNWCSYHSDWALYDCVMKEKMAVPEIVINSIKLDMAMHQSRRFLPPMGLTSPSPGLGAILDSSPVPGAVPIVGKSPSSSESQEEQQQQQQQQKFVRYIKDKVMTISHLSLTHSL